jgi:hypothetical protein
MEDGVTHRTQSFQPVSRKLISARARSRRADWDRLAAGVTNDSGECAGSRYQSGMQATIRATIWQQQIPLGAGVLLALLGFILGHAVSGPGVQLNPFAAGHPAEPVLAKLLVWACVSVITCGCRQPLRDLLVARRRSPLLLLVALAFGPVTLADVAGSQFAIAASGYPTCAPGAVPLPPFFSFLPRTMILGTTMLLVLLAWSRHLANRAAAETVEAAPAPALKWPVAPPALPGEWLEIPEAPLLRVRAADVDLIRSAGNYSEIVAAGRLYLVRATLTELADRFAPLGYVRIHRQTIVNAQRVCAVRPQPGGRAVVHLYCGTALPIGGRYVDALRALR